MIGKDLNKQTNQTKLIAVISLVFSIFAIILTLYTVLNVNTTLQGYAKNPNSGWPGFIWWLPVKKPTLPPVPTSLPTNPIPDVIGPEVTIPVIPTISAIPSPLPQYFLYNMLSQGNGAPSGAHYNLNLIGVPKSKTASMTASEGRRIFVPLTGACQITLGEGEFAVLDGNCTDGKSLFQLPNPDPSNTGTTTYSVWARALGKPGGRSSATTCATVPDTGELYCSLYSLISIREKGKSSFSNVSRELLYIYADLNGDKKLERVPLFDSRLQDYYWQYDNQGLKLVQLRFYQVATRVP